MFTAGIQPDQNHRSCQYDDHESELYWWGFSPCTEVEQQAGQLEGGQLQGDGQTQAQGKDIYWRRQGGQVIRKIITCDPLY